MAEPALHTYASTHLTWAVDACEVLARPGLETRGSQRTRSWSVDIVTGLVSEDQKQMQLVGSL